jgi:uncharacterized membrane protein
VVRDCGGVLPWTLIRVVLLLVVLGVGGHDAGSIAWTAFNQRQTADLAAQEASSEWGHARDAKAARKAADDRVSGTDESFAITSYVIAPDGTVSMTLHTVANTYLLARIPALRHWASITSHTSVGPPLDARK